MPGRVAWVRLKQGTVETTPIIPKLWAVRRGVQGERDAACESRHESQCFVAFRAPCTCVGGLIVFFSTKVSILFCFLFPIVSLILAFVF